MKTFTKKHRTAGQIFQNHSLPFFCHACAPQRAFVGHLLRGPALQAKVNVGIPNDAYEQEANRVADTVLRMPEARLQAVPT